MTEGGIPIFQLDQMKWVNAPRITTDPGHGQCPNIPPGTLINQFVSSDVLKCTLGVIRAI